MRKTGCVGHGRAWASPDGRGNAHWWIRMVSKGLTRSLSFEMDSANPQMVVIPAKAGIQYAAASQSEYRRLWDTGSPAGACHRAALRADPVAGDDKRGLHHRLDARQRRDEIAELRAADFEITA